jgi:hypothetical protein
MSEVEELPLRLLTPDGREWTFQWTGTDYQETAGGVKTLEEIERHYGVGEEYRGWAPIEVASEEDVKRACSAIRMAGRAAAASVAAAVKLVLPLIETDAEVNPRSSAELAGLSRVEELAGRDGVHDGAVVVLAQVLKRVALDDSQYTDVFGLLVEAFSSVADEGGADHWRTLVGDELLPGGRKTQVARQGVPLLLAMSAHREWVDAYR